MARPHPATGKIPTRSWFPKQRHRRTSAQRRSRCVRKATDAQAATALDSILDHVVTGPRLARAKNTSATAKGTLEIRKVDGAKPVVVGQVVLGIENTAGWHKRTIDWDFTKGTGTFESQRRDGSDIERLAVVADTPTHKRQTFRSTVGAIDTEATVDTRKVTLKTGGTAEVVTAEDRVTVGAQAAVAFAASGGAKMLLKGGYVKTTGTGGAEVYTRKQTTVGGRPVTQAELDGFLKNRVVQP